MLFSSILWIKARLGPNIANEIVAGDETNENPENIY